MTSLRPIFALIARFRRSPLMRPAAGVLAAVALLALVGALALPHQAQAQTTTTFVSNTGEAQGTSIASIVAQSFTTGSNPGGYTLSEVAIRYNSMVPGATGQFVTVKTDASGAPGDLVANLSNPASFVDGANNSFAAPASTTLAASTVYWVVVNEGRQSERINTHRTNSHGQAVTTEDPTWSIADTRSFKSSLSESTWSSANTPLMIAIKGTAVGGTPPPSTDATLSGLVVNDGSSNLTLTPTFASGTYEYAAMVASTVTEVTVTPTTTDDGATIEYLDSSDAKLTDADTSADGHQVTLAEGDNVIKVKVTAADGSTKTYTVTVNRAAAATTGICDRTQQIQDAILAELSGVDDCAAVTVANLASITEFGTFGFGTFNQGITSLKKGDFAGLTSLTVLKLGQNGLTSLPEGIFAGLAELADLNLSVNQLESLPEGIFAGLAELAELDLSGNQLESLPEGAFDGLVKLRYLSLAGSSLTELRAGEFTGLTALEDLLLSGNDLSSLPEEVFSDLTALTDLLLSGNDLSSLPEELFSGLTALEQLDLGGNDLDSLPEELFSGLTALNRLDLGGNSTDPLPLTVTVEKVGTDQVRVKVLAGAPFAVAIPVTLVNGTLAGSATALSVAAGSVYGTAVTMTRTDGTTAAVTVDVDLSTQPTLPANHFGYIFKKATTNLPATILPAPTCTLNTGDGDIWCGVVTVGGIIAITEIDAYGFIESIGVISSAGDLSDKEFSVTTNGGTNSYTIYEIAVGSSSVFTDIGTLSFALTSALTDDDRAKLVLHVDGSSTSFAFSDATAPTVTYTYVWSSSGLDWSSTSEVTLRLQLLPASTDATLSDLVVNDGSSDLALNPTFASDEYTYTASVGTDVAEVTVTPTLNDTGATIEYLDGDDATLDDANISDDPHQVAVAVAVGDNVIKVKVTAQDGNTTKTYTVTVKRAAPAPATTFVSNLEQTNFSGDALTSTGLTRAQQFKTGTNSDGYTLTEIVVNIQDARTGTPAFALYTNGSGNKPGTKIVDLSGNSSTPGAQSFIPASTTNLSASTKYFIVFSMTEGQANLQRTASNDIDPGASTGWDIAENSVFGASWSSAANSVEIAVKGNVGTTELSTDATLSGLVVNDGSTDLTLTPIFTSDTYAYDAKVASTVAEVTVTPTKNDTTATIEYLDASDMTLTDADTSANGQQVTLTEGDNVIKVKLTTADGNTTHTYTVTVNRPATTLVTIAADQPAFTAELHNVTFTLTRTEDMSAALDVAVALTQTLDLLGNQHLAQTVTFDAGEDTATLIIQSYKFSDHTLGSDGGSVTLTATVQTGSGYEPGSPDTVSTRVVVANPAITAWIEATAYTFDEDATGADTTIPVILRTATGVPSPHSPFYLSISANAISGQAELDVDFERLSLIFQVFPSDFTPDGAEFTARKEVRLVLVDDDLNEPDETLTVALERIGGTPMVVVLIQPDGTACPGSKCEVTVTIVDNDAPVPTAAKLSGLVVNDGITDLTLRPTFASDTYAYDAKVASTVSEVTVTPTLNDATSTIEYLKESDNPLDDANASDPGHQVALAEGDNVFKVKVTTADGNATQTYTVTVDRASATPTICTLNTGDIWCGVVTVGAITWVTGIGTFSGYGFDSGGGDLSDKEFSYGPNSYTIDYVRLTGTGTSLFFSLTAALADADQAELALHVGRVALAFSDADGPTSDYSYHWSRPGLVLGGLRHAAAARGGGLDGRDAERAERERRACKCERVSGRRPVPGIKYRNRDVQRVGGVQPGAGHVNGGDERCRRDGGLFRRGRHGAGGRRHGHGGPRPRPSGGHSAGPEHLQGEGDGGGRGDGEDLHRDRDP